MNIELLSNEEVLKTISGKSFEANPIARLMSKFSKLWGSYNKVTLTLTSKRCFVEMQSYFLWFIPVSRNMIIASLSDISSIQGIKTSSLLIFKSYNLIISTGGVQLVGVNLKNMDNDKMDAEINSISFQQQTDSTAKAA